MCSGPEDEDEAQEHEQELGQQVDDPQECRHAGRLLQAADARKRHDAEHGQAAGHRPRRGRQGRPEHAQVARDEGGRERREGDQREAHRPAGEEARKLVEGVPGERRRSARLGEHRHPLGVADRDGREDQAGREQGDRGEAEAVDRDQAERRDRSTSPCAGTPRRRARPGRGRGGAGPRSCARPVSAAALGRGRLLRCEYPYPTRCHPVRHGRLTIRPRRLPITSRRPHARVTVLPDRCQAPTNRCQAERVVRLAQPPRSAAIGHAPSLVLAITVRVVPVTGSWVLRNETPAS